MDGSTARRLSGSRAIGSILALGLLALVVSGPVYAFLTLSEIPFAVRLLLPVVALTAWFAPRGSLLGFAAGAPLLPILPSAVGWPPVSLPEMWALGLLVGATPRLIFQGAHRPGVSLPAPAVLLIALGTVSMVVKLYPFHLSAGGVWPLLVSLWEFWRSELIVSSQRHMYAAISSWVLLLDGLLMLWLCLRIARDRRGAAQLVEAAAIGAGIVAILGVFQWWTGRGLLQFWREQDPNIVRINATFSDVNGLGAYLAMMIWPIVALAMSGSRPGWRLVYRVLACAAAASIVFTASRAAWLAAGIGGLMFVVSIWRAGLLAPQAAIARHFRRWLAVGTAAVAVSLGLLTAYATSADIRHERQRNYADTLLYSLNLNVPLNERLKGRLPLWESAIKMIETRPIFGIGISRYYKEVASFSPEPELLINAQENAHNYFLQVAAELGLSGLACLIALFALAIQAALRATSRATIEREHRYLAAAAAAGLLAFAVASLTGHPMLVREGQFAFAVLAAGSFLFGRGRTEAKTTAGVPGRSEPGRWTRIAALAACAVIVATIPIRARQETDRVDLSRLPFGLYDPEVAQDGAVFRWSTQRTTLHVPAEAAVFTLPLRSLAPFAQIASVSFDDRLADRVQLDDHAWHRLRYPLPARRDRGRFVKVDIDVSPTWQPPGEGRMLGVMVGEYGWTK